MQELPQVLLPLADIQLLGSHMPDGPLLQVLIRQLEQRPGQPFGDVIFDEGLLHRRGKPQQPQLIAQGGGAHRQQGGSLILGHAALNDQPQDALGFLYVVQVAAVQVFRQGQGGGIGIILLPHQRRDAAPAEHLAGTPPALPGNEAVAPLRQRPHRDGIQQAAAVDALGQGRQLLLVEVPAGLVGAGGDLPNGQLLHRRLFFPVQKGHISRLLYSPL